MKSLEICLSSGYGGLELYMVKVARYLHQNNHSVAILVRKNSFLDKKLGELELPRHYLKTTFYHFPLIAAWRLARFIRRNQIDLIHMHHGKDLFLCVLAKVLAGRGKIIYTRQMALTRYKHDVYHRFLYQRVNAYLVITQALYHQAIKYLPIKKQSVQVLYYGVPQPPADAEDCATFLQAKGVAQDALKVAIFGRVEAIKGQHLVVSAVRKLVEQGHQVQAAIIGHVMDEDYFKKLQNEIEQNNMQQAIHYLGFHNSPVSIMPCFDVVILATRCETFGLVLPEAMRAGTCVIGTDCGGVPEIITHGKTGLLFQPEQADDLADQLTRLIQEPNLLDELARNGKQDADERFSEERHFERLMQAFTQVLQSGTLSS